MSVLQTLIDKQDNFEIIRDQIAAILKLEIVNQQVLAAAALKDPDDWKLRIFSERSNPWEQWVNVDDPATVDKSPLINVWFDNSTFDPSASNVSERQKCEAVYNIDCYGYGISEDVPAGGHKPGDRDAALKVHKALRLIRNILMASENTYLQLQGLVWTRWPQAITSFQPQMDGRQIQQIVGARLAFRVVFNEHSPQYVAETLEFLSIDVKRTEDGEIVAEADYDYIAP